MFNNDDEYDDWCHDQAQMQELSDAQKLIQQQSETISRLKLQLGRDPDEKLSPCCGETLIKFISQNRKVCYACDKEYTWNLDPGQKPLFNRSSD